jgi:mono/diheme cytochrome c family protein
VFREARSIAAVALAAVVTGGACTRIEYTLGKVPFLAYMRDAPSFDPYEATRPAPPGAVPFASPAGETFAMIQPVDSLLVKFGNGPHGTNPFPVDSAFTALGRSMYETNCTVCHGPSGLGGTTGSIVQKDASEGRYPFPPPNLTLPLTVNRTDGYIYALIWVGRGLMPAYGPRITHKERWAIVHYVRQLQAVAAQQTGGGN